MARLVSPRRVGNSGSMQLPPLAALGAVGALVLAACGANDSAACTETREPADPQSFSHVIDPDAVRYSTDPPTSGPHIAVEAPSGMLDSPIAAPIQVRILESGAALVQWEGLDRDAVAVLNGLAGPEVVVAPGRDLPAAIVATAWTWKLTCDALDVDALVAFAAERPLSAPGTD